MSGSWDVFREYMSNPANSDFIPIPFMDSRGTDPDDYAKPKQFENEEDKLKFYDGCNVEDRNLDSPDGRV
ncbi:hypothetical protein PENFLA_c031G05294 [Penicillium flavigenum]|uniref:Uncharacterized protein n=1 Tax=Penicillium flavigenum TaxID=254877 RepID=A0A1V6SPE3_9EURO|nr:hypothetical protein PENFLA_c031G05294 [Penicillium flavigenum]